MFVLPAYDHGTALSADEAAIYITGLTRGRLDDQDNAGFNDVFVAKYDFQGNRQWTRMLGTPDSDVGHAISVDSSGVYVAGATSGDLDGQGNAGRSDIFLAKYSSDGDRKWVVTKGTAAIDGASEMSVRGGGIYMTGRTLGALDGKEKAGDAEDSDVFIVKYIEP